MRRISAHQPGSLILARLHDGVLARQHDMRAVFWIALEADRDVMALHLRWSEHLVDHAI